MSTKSFQSYIRDLGRYLQHERLRQNLSQEQVAAMAGISRRTVLMLENGEGGTLKSFVLALYGINRLDVMDAFKVLDVPSPILLAKAAKAKRKRASGSRGAKEDQNQDSWNL